jgi:Kyakuja-Dileera-Zisupton transposase
LAEQFTAAYDVYLEIQRCVNVQIQVALGYNSPRYRLLNVCPTCFYKLDDEPHLKFSSFCAVDGNNSLKCLCAAIDNAIARLDSRSLPSDRWLSAEEVNRFADEVKRQPVGVLLVQLYLGRLNTQQVKNPNPDVAFDDWEDDQDSPQAECVKQWRNAGPEQRKKMFALFEESGIFIAVCRHHFLLLGCDMIRSGELYVSSPSPFFLSDVISAPNTLSQ